MLRINGCPLKAHPSRNALFCIGMCVNMFAVFCSTLILWESFLKRLRNWFKWTFTRKTFVFAAGGLTTPLFKGSSRIIVLLGGCPRKTLEKETCISCYTIAIFPCAHFPLCVTYLYSPSHPRWIGGWGSWDLDYRQFPPHCRCQLPSFLLHELLWWWTLGLLWHWIV